MLNDWEIGRFLKIVLAISLAFFTSIALDIPILRQLSAFIFLSFLPGVLILRVLKIHKISPVESILYSVGLSLAFLIFIGLLINTFYPAIGISHPISILPLTITIGILVLGLSLLCFWIDRSFNNPNPIKIKVKNIFSTPVLFLLLMPLLSAIGAYMVNFYGNIILLLLVIGLIALTVLLVALNRFITQDLYPLAVLMIAISLLFHTSLISSSLVGYDNRIEYYFFKAVETNAHWDSNIPYATPTNSMMSMTILPSIFAIQSGIDDQALFKIVYPLFFSLIPLGSYQAFRTQVSDRTAFLSAFVVMSYFEFFGEMPFLLKQGLATFFIVLIIMAILHRSSGLLKGRLLLLVFSAALVLSHYGSTYLFMLWILLSLPLLYWLKYEDKVLSKTYILFFFVITFSWYMYTSTGSPLSAAVGIGKHIFTSLRTEVFAPEETALGVRLMAQPQTLLRLMSRIWFITFYFFMAVGIFRLVLGLKRPKLYPEYTAVTFASFVILLIHLFTPYAAQSFNVSRILGVTLVILAPMCIIGGETVFSLMRNVAKLLKGPLRNLLSRFQNHLPGMRFVPGRVIFIFMIVWLLFQSEFIYAVVQEPTSSPIAFNLEMDFTKFNVQDETAAKWLVKTKMHSGVIGDNFCKALLWSYFGEPQVSQFTLANEWQIKSPPQDAYVFLRSYNIKHNLLGFGEIYVDLQKLDLSGKNKVYDNGDALIYK